MTLTLPVVLQSGDDLLLAHESWSQYPLDLIDESFGHEQAHSIDGKDADDGKTWVLMAKPQVEGWKETTLTENDYMKWSAQKHVEARDAEVAQRLTSVQESKDQEVADAAQRDRALKQLKKAGIDLADLKSIIFGATT